ncbi:hypothetical protein B0T19DRAFT_262507 [Cercophora scortea]|uniref:Clr5 domain-containing protein n=1 Tax=Cercophora scortea TaxID=314031 RepID=A0AAE0M7C0_9PEZI|nr:hypothetical protein B0T19DRAFT_262507 [Cercophora scortea]
MTMTMCYPENRAATIPAVSEPLAPLPPPRRSPTASTPSSATLSAAPFASLGLSLGPSPRLSTSSSSSSTTTIAGGGGGSSSSSSMQTPLPSPLLHASGSGPGPNPGFGPNLDPRRPSDPLSASSSPTLQVHLHHHHDVHHVQGPGFHAPPPILIPEGKSRILQGPSAKDWARHRDTIIDLYKQYPLKKVSELMRKHHGFAARKKKQSTVNQSPPAQSPWRYRPAGTTPPHHRRVSNRRSPRWPFRFNEAVSSHPGLEWSLSWSWSSLTSTLTALPVPCQP